MYDVAALAIAPACFAFMSLAVFAHLVYALFRGENLWVGQGIGQIALYCGVLVPVGYPLLEAVEREAVSAGVPVDARIEKGRSRTHALRRLWQVERFDRLLVPAPTTGRGGGLTEEELAWLLVHAPPETETLVLRPRTAAP